MKNCYDNIMHYLTDNMTCVTMTTDFHIIRYWNQVVNTLQKDFKFSVFKSTDYGSKINANIMNTKPKQK